MAKAKDVGDKPAKKEKTKTSKKEVKKTEKVTKKKVSEKKIPAKAEKKADKEAVKKVDPSTVEKKTSSRSAQDDKDDVKSKSSSSKRKAKKSEDKKEKTEEKMVEVKEAPKKVKKITAADYKVDLRELLEAGCHFGHQARRWNPKMAPYVYAEKDGVHIFDLAISAKKITEAMEFIRDWVASGKDIVFVGTKRQASAIVREETAKVGAPYVTVRWLGGTLTNWGEMKKRIKILNNLKKQREEGVLEKKYTKKERVLIDREIARLERFFGGMAHLPGRPTALFVVDSHREITAVKEANLLDVPVVAMLDTNADPDMVNYPIPVNDDAVRSIKLVVTKMAEAYADGMSRRGKVTKEKGVETRK